MSKDVQLTAVVGCVENVSVLKIADPTYGVDTPQTEDSAGDLTYRGKRAHQ